MGQSDASRTDPEVSLVIPGPTGRWQSEQGCHPAAGQRIRRTAVTHRIEKWYIATQQDFCYFETVDFAVLAPRGEFESLI
jgi:hypothetical protein